MKLLVPPRIVDPIVLATVVDLLHRQSRNTIDLRLREVASQFDLARRTHNDDHRFVESLTTRYAACVVDEDDVAWVPVHAYQWGGVVRTDSLWVAWRSLGDARTLPQPRTTPPVPR